MSRWCLLDAIFFNVKNRQKFCYSLTVHRDGLALQRLSFENLNSQGVPMAAFCQSVMPGV